MKKLICLLLILFSSHAIAEYRVYQYYVSSRLRMPEDQRPYLVTSTLDPVSYVAYHGGNKSIKLDLLRTWSCPGHTGNKRELCMAPSEALDQELAPDEGLE